MACHLSYMVLRGCEQATISNFTVFRCAIQTKRTKSRGNMNWRPLLSVDLFNAIDYQIATPGIAKKVRTERIYKDKRFPITRR